MTNQEQPHAACDAAWGPVTEAAGQGAGEAGEDAVRCIHCHQGFDDSGQLNEHLRVIHKGAANRVAKNCISCGEVTSELTSHMQAAHQIRSPQYPCRVCNHPFNRPRARNRHEWDDHTESECLDRGLVRLA